MMNLPAEQLWKTPSWLIRHSWLHATHLVFVSPLSDFSILVSMHVFPENKVWGYLFFVTYTRTCESRRSFDILPFTVDFSIFRLSYAVSMTHFGSSSTFWSRIFLVCLVRDMWPAGDKNYFIGVWKTLFQMTML